MKAHSSINEVVQEIAENIRSATWKDLESRKPPTLVHRFLKSIDSGRIPVHGPIVIREREPTKRPPNTSAWKVIPGTKRARSVRTWL